MTVTRSTLRLTLWLASAFALAAWLVVAARTLAGGAPSDPLEATLLDHASRFASPAPGLLPASPALVLPGMPWALAPLVATFGAQPWEPRLVSLLATLLGAITVAL